jgi:hypothetical protein
MKPKLEDLERLLTGRGFECCRLGEAMLTASIPTRSYTNLQGKQRMDIWIRMDEEHNCLVMESQWAFDTKQTVHKEAMLACLMGAAFRTPLIRTQHDPRDGEVRLRIDSLVGDGGISTDSMIRMIEAIPAFADAWYPQIKNAMVKGSFDLDRPPPAATERDQRLEQIATRAGGINRLRALLAIRERPQSRPGDGPSLN